MSFTPRFKSPEANNKYYNTKLNGGYSNCIIGNANPYNGSTRKGWTGLNVLPNCVGWCLGRFNEIVGEWKYAISGNAEDFYINAPKYGLKVGQTPKVGAIMCWRKGNTNNGNDGYGHVMIVEKVVSPTEVICSESGWSYKGGAMWIATHKKGSGNWVEGGDYNWMRNGYTFQGFIYNPGIEEELIPNDLMIICYGANQLVVKAINKNNINYVRLKDMEEKIHLCGIGWFNNSVYINGVSQNMSELDHVEIEGENYVKLRDFENVLHLCNVGYDVKQKCPTITI